MRFLTGAHGKLVASAARWGPGGAHARSLFLKMSNREPTPQFHSHWRIHLQERNGGSSAGGQTSDLVAVIRATAKCIAGRRRNHARPARTTRARDCSIATRSPRRISASYSSASAGDNWPSFAFSAKSSRRACVCGSAGAARRACALSALRQRATGEIARSRVAWVAVLGMGGNSCPNRGSGKSNFGSHGNVLFARRGDSHFRHPSF